MRFILFLFSFFTLSIHAQDYARNLKGRVTDKDTRQPLEGVNIVLQNVEPFTATTTDAEGNFKFESLKAGRYNLKFSMMGYDEVSLQNITVTSGKETVLTVEMQERINNMEDVVITAQKDRTRANNEFAPISARSFSMEETRRYAGTLNDPARMVQTFPGVISANDENNAIVVRGNSPRGILWRMEGVEIPNPNHFAGSEGSSGGGVAMLSANMLGKTDFLSGAFPAEYGNALSGVMDLNLRKGNNEKHEFTLQAGILGAEVALEGPFSKKSNASYLVNYRYSTLELFALTGFKIGGDVTPKYQDLSFNLAFPTRRAGTFTLFGIGGLSSLGTKVVRDTTKWESIIDKTQDGQHYHMGTAGITHLLLLNQKTYIKSVASFSYSDNSSSTDTFNTAFAPTIIEDKKFEYMVARFSFMLNRKVDTRNIIRTGMYYTGTFYNLRNRVFDFQQQQLFTSLQGQGHTHLFQAYWQWKHRFSESLSINSGLHLTYFLLNKKFNIEPRLSVEWRPAFYHTLSVGVGLHNRADAVSTYITELATTSVNQRDNRMLDMSKAFHSVVGYDFVFLKDFRLHAETYFQYLYAIPTGRDANAAFSIINENDGFVTKTLNNKGRGMNYGLELTVEKFFTKGYFFLVTTSLYNSKYRGNDKVWRNTAYNGNYVLNVLGSKEFLLGKKKINIIGITAKVLLRGGMRITPIDLDKSIVEGRTVRDESRLFEEQLPLYFRMDFGTYFRRNKKRWSWILSFDAQNIINRENVAQKVYDPQKKEIRLIRNLGIVPVISWKVEFGVKGKG